MVWFKSLPESISQKSSKNGFKMDFRITFAWSPDIKEKLSNLLQIIVKSKLLIQFWKKLDFLFRAKYTKLMFSFLTSVAHVRTISNRLFFYQWIGVFVHLILTSYLMFSFLTETSNIIFATFHKLEFLAIYMHFMLWRILLQGRCSRKIDFDKFAPSYQSKEGALRPKSWWRKRSPILLLHKSYNSFLLTWHYILGRH